MLGFVPERKVTHKIAQQIVSDITHVTIWEPKPGEIYKIEKRSEELKIERMIDRRGK